MSSIEDKLDKAAVQIEYCGRLKKVGDRMITLHCRKPICPKCGGSNKLIHTTRYKAAMRKISGFRAKSMRQLVFTVPSELRDSFKSKEMLNKLFDLIQRLVKREFGRLLSERKTRRGTIRKYQLDKLAVATIHLFGDSKLVYNPHINVQIFNKSIKGRSLHLSQNALERIKRSYRKSLQALVRRPIKQVVINYQFAVNQGDIKQRVWYMTRPFDPDVIFAFMRDLGDISMEALVLAELQRFRYIRYWGTTTN